MIHLLIEYLKPTSSEKAMPLRSFAAQTKKGSDLRNTQNENPWTSLVLSPFSRKLTFCLLPLPKPNIQTSLQSPPLGLPDLKEFGSLQPWHFHGEEIRLATAISPIWVETLKDLEKHTPLVALTLHTKIVADMLLILRKALWPKHELICVNLCLWILNISQPAHWQILETLAYAYLTLKLLLFLSGIFVVFFVVRRKANLIWKRKNPVSFLLRSPPFRRTATSSSFEVENQHGCCMVGSEIRGTWRARLQNLHIFTEGFENCMTYGHNFGT